MSSSCSFCCRPINLCPIKTVTSPRQVEFITPRRVRFHFGRIRASKVESYGSSPDFVERMERAWLISQRHYLYPYSCSNQGQLLVPLVSQMGMSNANGAVELGSLLSVITCCVKSLQETQLVSSVQERVLYAVLTAKELASVRNGLGNLQLLNNSMTFVGIVQSYCFIEQLNFCGYILKSIMWYNLPA